MQVLSLDTIEALYQVGHSRIPVCEAWDRRSQIFGFLLVKNLIRVNPLDCIPVAHMQLVQPLVVDANQSLLYVLTMFQAGSSHLVRVGFFSIALLIGNADCFFLVAAWLSCCFLFVFLSSFCLLFVCILFVSVRFLFAFCSFSIRLLFAFCLLFVCFTLADAIFPLTLSHHPTPTR